MFKKIWDVLAATVTVAKNEDLPKEQRPKKRKPAEVKAHVDRLQKEKADATERGEPWVGIVTMDIDYSNLVNGSFELDWNDQFIARLLRFGYQGKTDADLVDQWFNDVCRNVVLETYEQAQADLHPVKSSNLGNGRREYK